MQRRDWLKTVSAAGLMGAAGWAVRVPAASAAAPAPDNLASAPAGSAASRALSEVVEGYFDDVLDLNPLQGTFLGETKYARRLGNPSAEASIAAGVALERQALRAARALSTEGLSDQEALTLQVFLRDRAEAVEAAQFPEHLLPVNQMDNLGTTLALFGSGAGPQPFVTLEDHEAWIERAWQFPQWAESTRDRLREGVARGVTQPRQVMSKVVPQWRGLVSADPMRSLFCEPLKQLPANITSGQRAWLERAYRQLVERGLNPALTNLTDYFEKDYLPACRTSFGWNALPQGEAWYALRIRQGTTTHMGAKEIHVLGLSEVARIEEEMRGVMRETNFIGDLPAFFRFMQDDPRFYFTRGSDLLAEYQRVKKRIDALLPRLFSLFPKADYEVREVEPFRAQSSAGGFYQPPSADGTRPGYFYVNTYNLKAQPKFGMETLSLHEAAPGHHFQIALQQELPGLPRFRRYGGYNAYVEGWALYAESLGKELGVFTDPYQWYGRLADEMLRAMRLVVDTGLHSMGWSREQAMQYMATHSSMAGSDIEAEVERYIVWPGQALGYKVGQLRIRALRNAAEQAMGARFDVKAFHAEVLRDGSLPLDVLETKLRHWMSRAA
jgi:uncharacterized protein (DUF885 family)